MNVKIIGVLIAIVLLGGGALFVLSGDGDDGVTQEQQEQTGNQLGIDTAALDGPYSLTLTGTENGETMEGQFEFDGNDNYRMVMSQAGESIEVVFVDGQLYFQDPTSGSWVYYPPEYTGGPDIDPDEFTPSNEDINSFNDSDNLESLGEQACSTGMCRVYQEFDEEDGTTALIKVDVASGRLVEVEVTNNETSEVTKLSYAYPDDIKITAPEGAIELEIPGL